jgi:hypothetical protein
MNPYAKSFHAYSTDSNAAMETPLIHKQQTLPAIVIPPRISSKHESLPSPDTAVEETTTRLSNSLLAKPGCTKWPALPVTEETTKGQADDKAFGKGHCLTASPDKIECAPFDGADVTQSHYGSIDSVSTWSLAAGLSLDDEADVNYEGSVQVKRLSWHSSNPGRGPTLRISADADAVLLGRDESIPAVPAVLEHMPRKSSQQRSGGTMPGRVSKQILVRSDASAGSRTPTPSSTETETIGSRPIKITPIRSMQSPRKHSTGDPSRRSPFLSTPVSTEVAKVQGSLDACQADVHSAVEALQESVSLHAYETLTTSTEEQPTTKPESSMTSVMSEDFSKNACVGRLQIVCRIEVNVSYRKPEITQQHCKTEYRRRLCKSWAQRQIHHSWQPANACR